jgi:hypothetical protein
MTYAVLMDELEKRKKQEAFEQVNYILKELHKMLKLFSGFKDKGIKIFSPVDA